MDNLSALIGLHAISGMGPKRLDRLLSHFGSALDAWYSSTDSWSMLGLPPDLSLERQKPYVKEAIAISLDWLAKPECRIIAYDASDYPELLKQLPDAPPVLFIQGNSALLNQPQIAIVGSRKASKPGLDVAESFSKALAQHGLVITSGLADGIDAAAHRGALAGGHSIAVVGTGIDRVYPKKHAHLAQSMLEKGHALVSEFPLGAPPNASHFPRRNRIISGLSMGVLVVEAAVSSGSLITAKLAAEQGRDVWAIPGSIHHPGARGCHQIIRDGAQLVDSVEQILSGLSSWQWQPKLATGSTSTPVNSSYQNNPTLPQSEGEMLLDLLRAAPQSTEALASQARLSVSEILAQLTDLEIEGKVCRQGTQWLACA